MTQLGVKSKKINKKDKSLNKNESLGKNLEHAVVEVSDIENKISHGDSIV